MKTRNEIPERLLNDVVYDYIGNIIDREKIKMHDKKVDMYMDIFSKRMHLSFIMMCILLTISFLLYDFVNEYYVYFMIPMWSITIIVIIYAMEFHVSGKERILISEIKQIVTEIKTLLEVYEPDK